MGEFSVFEVASTRVGRSHTVVFDVRFANCSLVESRLMAVDPNNPA